MSASLSVSNGNTTITLAYTASTARVTSTCLSAAQWIWNHGGNIEGLAFDELTNNQKLDLIDSYILNRIRHIAELQNEEDQVNLARLNALSETKTKFI